MEEITRCFNEQFRDRTKRFAILLCRVFDDLPCKESTRIITRQILRSAFSVAANFRAVSRARSSAEYYSKLCIFVEECDETLFWLEIIEDLISPENPKFSALQREAFELLKVFSTAKKKLKERLKTNNSRTHQFINLPVILTFAPCPPPGPTDTASTGMKPMPITALRW